MRLKPIRRLSAFQQRGTDHAKRLRSDVTATSSLVRSLQRSERSSSRELWGTFCTGGGTVGETLSIVTTDHMLRRIRGEYLEMPGLRLTRRQAQRLWGLDEPTCAQLLDSLAEAKFLYRKDDGTYARLTDGAVAAPADSNRL
jgi:hypothetical protein